MANRPPRPLSQKWQKPPVGFVKLNVDAAFHHSTAVAGLGGVFRDSNGTFLGDFCCHQLSVSSASHAKLLALLTGVEAACNHSLVPLMVESDCLDIVQATHSSSLDDSELGS